MKEKISEWVKNELSLAVEMRNIAQVIAAVQRLHDAEDALKNAVFCGTFEMAETEAARAHLRKMMALLSEGL